MLRVKQVREIFNITNPTIYRWIKSGKLPAPKYIEPTHKLNKASKNNPLNSFIT